MTLGPELDARRGLLGKGSLLATSSQPGRTSPVIRGNWVLQNLLGVPPPPPPPNVPKLKAESRDATGNARMPTLREQMEAAPRESRPAPGCHTLMDPIGFALEQFDAVGTWRTTDGAQPIDASSVMYDGTKIKGPADLRNFVLSYKDQFVTNGDGEAADVRARPRRRVLRHAGRAQRSCATPTRTTTASHVDRRRRQERRRFS